MFNSFNNNWKELTTFVINRAFVLCGLVYLACIPLGVIDSEQKKLQLEDIGIFTILLVANSNLIQRVSQLRIGKDGVELSAEIIQKEVKKEIDKRSHYESDLLQTIDLHLSETIPVKISQQNLKEQIQKVSSVIAEYIYFRAKEVRHQAWRSHKKGITERTIPIFRALIESEKGKQRHRFYAQLGYALKDQEKPQWREAMSSLEKAIQLWEKENSSKNLPPYYCFNWLICLAKVAQENDYEESYHPVLRKIVSQRLDSIASCEQLITFLRESEIFRVWWKKFSRGSKLEEQLISVNGSCQKENYSEDESSKLLG